jgi:pyruvate,orthophosphate dikinase
MVSIINFSENEFLEGDDLQERFGLRGRNMLQLAQLKLPIAPGFLIESSALKEGKLKEELTLAKLEASVKKIEALTGKTYNSPKVPMMFKVVASPSIQIGSIRSVHTIGINDEVTQAFAKFCGEEFAFHEYQHFMESIGTRFLKKKKAEFDAILQSNPKASHKELCELYRQKVVPDFPQNGYEQLRLVITSMAEQYQEDPMNEGIEAGLMAQMMVYGNFGENSYNGSFFSRDIVTGAPQLTGFFGHNEFDTPPERAKDVNSIKKEYLDQLRNIAILLEEKFLDIREIKFVIEENKAWVVEQNPVDSKSTQAEMRTLLDLHAKNLITAGKLVSSIPPAQVQDLLHPVIDHTTTLDLPKVVGGLAASPGAAVGRVCYSTKRLLAEYRRCSLMGTNSDLILCMPHTDAEDVEGIEMAKGVIASGGDRSGHTSGYASHAAVVSRSLRKPCLLINSEELEFHDGHAMLGGNHVNELDTISMEVPTYTEPTVWLGPAQLVYPDTATNGLEDFIRAISTIRSDFKVFGKAETLADIKVALRLGAEGIGLFPCDNMLKFPDVLRPFRQALLLVDPAARTSALKQAETHLKGHVAEILKVMDGKKLRIRLLSEPLTEFLPHSPEELETFLNEVAHDFPGVGKEELITRANQLRNVNPMLGLRGSRIAISYPDLYSMQVAAILRAGLETVRAGGRADLDLMVPSVMADAEIRFIRFGRNIESTTIKGISTMEQELLQEFKLDMLPFTCRVGASIEFPAAALMAGHMAKQSEFFSIDTHMLTQTTNGMSFDDVNMFLPSYTQYDILKDNPFQILSTAVKELITATVQLGKITRPDMQIGLAGDHASDPVNIEFAFRSNLGFVTCSPYGVPMARLAVAQHMVKS